MNNDGAQLSRAVEGVSDVEVNMTSDPPWSPDRMSEEAQVAVGMY